MTDNTDYTSITELPGQQLTKLELNMIMLRYVTALKHSVGKSVLEIGCGPGLGVKYLCQGGVLNYTGADINEKSINIAKENNSNLENASFDVVDAHKLPYGDNSFDTVICFEVIFYFQNLKQCLSEMKRVLKKDGKLIVCLPNNQIKGFIPSPFSCSYHSNIELVKELSMHFNQNEIYGAFPLPSDIVKEARYLRFKIAKLLNIIPQSKLIKKKLKRLLMKQNISLPRQIDIPEEFRVELNKISITNRDTQHKILYAVSNCAGKTY